MNRECGECQLCCKLLPVEELGKKADTRCKHQKNSLGCVIYPTRPFSCRVWSCRWLIDTKTAHMRRPDRVHYVVDIAPDTIWVKDHTMPERVALQAVAVWVDKNWPDAHHDPELRNYLNRYKLIAIVRYNSVDGFVLFPPSLTGKGWLEHASNIVVDPHTGEKIK